MKLVGGSHIQSLYLLKNRSKYVLLIPADES